MLEAGVMPDEEAYSAAGIGNRVKLFLFNKFLYAGFQLPNLSFEHIRHNLEQFLHYCILTYLLTGRLLLTR